MLFCRSFDNYALGYFVRLLYGLETRNNEIAVYNAAIEYSSLIGD